jgi:hypothetical protein
LHLYKRYHSIHAKGEDVEDALRQAEEEVPMIEGKTSNRRDGRIMTEAGDGTVKEERADGNFDADNAGKYTPLQAMVTIEDGPAITYHSEESIPHDGHSSSVALPGPEELQSTGTVQGGLLAGVGNMPHSVLGNGKKCPSHVFLGEFWRKSLSLC